MKVLVKNIRWDINEKDNEVVRKAMELHERKAKEMFEQGAADEERLIAELIKNDELEAPEDYDREYDDFEKYFDRAAVLGEVIETNLGLPSSAVIDVPEEYTNDDILHALKVKYSATPVLDAIQHDKARGNEVAKQEIIDAVDNIVKSDDFKSYLDLAENFKNYSTKNKLLVFAKNPNATMVKGMHTWWNDYGRSVNKGATAIWIYTPSLKTFNGEKDIQKFIDFAKESRRNTYIPERISEEKEAECVARLKAGEKLQFAAGFSIAPVFDVSDTHGKDFDYQKKDTVLDNEQANRVLDKYCKELDIKPCNNTFDTLKAVADHLLHGEQVLVPTIMGSAEQLSAAKRDIENGAVAYIVGRQLGLDATNHSLGSIAVALNDDAPGTRLTVFTKLYERIDKAAQYIEKCLDRHIEKSADKDEVDNDLDEIDR